MMVPSVLCVNNYHYPRGGSDRYFLQMALLLQEEGHRIRTFSSARGDVVRGDLLAVPALSGVDTSRAGSAKNIARYLYSPEARRRMAEAIAHFHPDIAHLHIYYGQLTASILQPLRTAEIPIVQTLHEYKLVCPTHGLHAHGAFCDACRGRSYWHAPLKRCNRSSVARSALSMLEAYVSQALGARNGVDRFIAVSEYQKKQLVRLGVPEHKLSVLYHFTDVPPEDRPGEGEYFLYVGRIIPEKGIPILLQALALMSRARPKLKIVGTGPHQEQWQDMARDLGIAGDVEWLGFRDGRELDDLYKSCRALINPSMLNETFGLTCLEALARGRPVVASRTGALQEVVSEGEDGILVAPGDASALAWAMEQLWSRPAEALRKGKRGREKVQQRFSKQRHYEGLLRIYHDVLGASRSSDTVHQN